MVRFLSFNAGGLRRGNDGAQRRGSWLLHQLEVGADIGVLALQETHCRDEGDFCQAVLDMRLRYGWVHSGPRDGDTHAGVGLLVSREYRIVTSEVLRVGRVLAVTLESVLFGYGVRVVVVYGYAGRYEPWLHDLERALTGGDPFVVMGDFNFVTNQRDRGSGRMLAYDMARLLHCWPWLVHWIFAMCTGYRTRQGWTGHTGVRGI